MKLSTAEGIGVYEVPPDVIETEMTLSVKDKYDALIADAVTGEPMGIPK